MLKRRTRSIPYHEREGKPWSVTLFKAINADGTLLWPEHNSIEAYRALWQSGSPALFRSVWLQDPSGLAGELFHPEWFKYFCYADATTRVHSESGRLRTLDARQMLEDGLVDKILERPAECVALQAHDLAISQSQMADFYARVNILAGRDGDIHVTDVYRAKLTDLQMIDDMTADRRPKPRAIGVEAVGFQQIVLNAAKREVRHLPFIAVGPYKNEPNRRSKYAVGTQPPAVKTPRDKVMRARPLADHFERGQVYLLYGAHWEQATRFELMAFPSGTHDDVVDAMAYCFELAGSYAFGRRWGELTRVQEQLRRETRQDLSQAFRA
jgi:predicted phage terminase large subunit-like protein